MADWCLCTPVMKVGYGSSTNIVTWRMVPKIVVVDVPDDMAFTETELLEFLKRRKPDQYLTREIEEGALRAQPPRYVLVQLGGKVPDEAMKRHFTREEFEYRNVYDWRGGYVIAESHLEQCKAFYKKYGILTKDEFHRKYGFDRFKEL